MLSETSVQSVVLKLRISSHCSVAFDPTLSRLHLLTAVIVTRMSLWGGIVETKWYSSLVVVPFATILSVCCWVNAWTLKWSKSNLSILSGASQLMESAWYDSSECIDGNRTLFTRTFSGLLGVSTLLSQRKKQQVNIAAKLFLRNPKPYAADAINITIIQ